MRTSTLIRRCRQWLRSPQENRLRAQLAAERDRNRALEQRLAELQTADVGAYHELSIARGAVCIKTNCPLCPPATKDGAA
ncbi:hypothetical protein ACIP6V_23635 [Streptomyces sp. NPDC088770]|uniref:hypothetical protein n=1 Tax=Streptomyces sp. NPDC088770 TaxID=3365895 RepID=UPI00381E8894